MTNRIVVNYFGYEGLVLLSAYDNISGIECDFDWVLETGANAKFDVVKKYHGVQDYKELKKIIDNNAEGFVIRFSSGFRMKIKGEEYVRLHRLLTNFSNVDIWELLKNKQDLGNFLDRVPDEFDLWVKKIIKELKYNYSSIEERANDIYKSFFEKRPDFEKDKGRKEFAEWAKEQDRSITSILFMLYDGNDYSEKIWKMIRPKYQKPFWNKKED